MGTKFKFFIIFSDFLSHNNKNGQFFCLNCRIIIQAVKFQFKRINQEPPRYYYLSTPVAGGRADATARPGSNASGSARPHQALAVVPTPVPSCLWRAGATARH
jgi:hypothetical protein